MLSSTARVATATPERYAKQLVAHLGRRSAAVEREDGSHQLALGDGKGVVAVGDDAVVLEATAFDEAALAVVEDVLARHLVRFGARQELQVHWVRGGQPVR